MKTKVKFTNKGIFSIILFNVVIIVLGIAASIYSSIFGILTFSMLAALDGFMLFDIYRCIKRMQIENDRMTAFIERDGGTIIDLEPEQMKELQEKGSIVVTDKSGNKWPISLNDITYIGGE